MDDPSPSPELPEPTTLPPHGGAASGNSSAASQTSDPFIGNAGPGFAPGDDPGDPADEPELAALIPQVSEDQIRSLLGNVGDGAHALVGVGNLDWVMTETDLARIGPPLTRIINRHPELAAVAARSDELAVAFGAGLYTWRSLLERQAVLAVRANEPRPVKHERTPAAAPTTPAPAPPDQPGGPTIEIPDDYVSAADRLRATRPEATP